MQAEKPGQPALIRFARILDEYFDELLVGRWRSAVGGEAYSESAVVLDYEDRYEVRLHTADVDPSELKVEASERRLTVRARSGSTIIEHSFSFALPIEREAVQARWAERWLLITIPKSRGKRVEMAKDRD
jgi:HSP20 family molecular chaperone IbpA